MWQWLSGFWMFAVLDVWIQLWVTALLLSLHGLGIHRHLQCFCPSIQQCELPPSLWHVWVIWDTVVPLVFILLKEGGKKQMPGSELPTCFSYLFPGNLMTSPGKRRCFCRHKIWLCWPESLGDMMHVLTSKNARSLQAGACLPAVPCKLTVFHIDVPCGILEKKTWLI